MPNNKQKSDNKNLNINLYTAGFYVFVILVMTIFSAFVDIGLAVIFFIVFIISLIVFIVTTIFFKRNINNNVLNYALEISSVQKDYMDNIALPIAVVDSLGVLSWYNKSFDTILENIPEELRTNKPLGKNIHSFITELSLEDFPAEIEGEVSKEINILDKKYNVVISLFKVEANRDEIAITVADDEVVTLYSIAFYDMTKETVLATKLDEQRSLSMLIYVDNYEEAFRNIEDVRRPVITAIIERNLEKFAKSIDGILKKYEKDKYILIFHKKYYERIKKDKFYILDEIREIQVGNNMAITLSIGLGIHEYSLSDSYAYAKTAIDLALGRGGDQAVVKDDDKFAYYGGKTKSVEKSTRVKARVKAGAFRELLEDSDKVLIMGHKRPDLDAIGAAVGVKACARILDKPARIVLDGVTTAVSALYEKVRDDDFYEEDVFISAKDAKASITENTLLVVVDVNRPSYVESPEVLEMVKNVVVFDHHRASADFIDNTLLSYVEPYASSASEMISEVVRYIDDGIKLAPIEADALLSGIVVDTKNFVVNAGVKTFEAAAFLKRAGADMVRVKSYFKNDMASYKAKATAVKNCDIYRESMAIGVCPSDVENPTVTAAQAADELLDIAGIRASFVLTQIDGTVYISARSFDDMNVQVIMEKIGGGGHMSVAGAQVQDSSPEEAIEKLKAAIDIYVEEGN